MHRNVLLSDVAREARVSTATVSRVLQNKGYVSVETREKVEAAIRSTGYRVNAVAQGLRSQRTNTIGHLLQSIVPNPFFAGVALGVEQEARRHGYSVLMFNASGNARYEAEGLERLMERRVDAIIFTTAVDAANVQKAVDAGLPVVQVERVTPVRTHSVVIDNFVGAADATMHLINQGHRRIAYIGVDYARSKNVRPYPGHTKVEIERLGGFKDVMQRRRLLNEAQVIMIDGYYDETLQTQEPQESFDATVSLLLQSPRPTAILASCDLIAAGVLQALYAAKVRVPEDISVIGFDNTFAPYLSPPLTTVEQPMEEIGASAARILIDALQEESSETYPRVIDLPTRLVVRASTGPAPK